MAVAVQDGEGADGPGGRLRCAVPVASGVAPAACAVDAPVARGRGYPRHEPPYGRGGFPLYAAVRGTRLQERGAEGAGQCPAVS